MKLLEKKILSFIETISSDRNSNSSQKKIISYSFPVEIICFNTLISYSQKSTNRFFYWAKPSGNIYFFGYDILTTCNLPGNIGEDASADFESQKENFITNKAEVGLDFVPLIIGGMVFPSGNKSDVWEDYSSSDWYIPKYIFITKENKSYIVLNFINEGDIKSTASEMLKNSFAFLEKSENDLAPRVNLINCSQNDNDFENWGKTINKILNHIDKKEFHKIVLSREVVATLSSIPSFGELADRLTHKFPACYNFVFRSGNSFFLGASPEKLLKISGNVLETDALAGSIQRGKTQEEDSKYADQLLSSKKDLAEQKAVLDFVLEAISRYSNEIDYNTQPIIKKLENIQHLWTPIKAKLKPGIPIFNIVNALHPTPAVCGVPCKKVVKFLEENEQHHRGLYSGIIGWFNFDNEGEFAVGIRSALIKNKKLYAYSGCGIVQGSDAKTEFEESQLKLRTIMSLFENENK